MNNLLNNRSGFFKNHKKVVMISATVLALAVIGTVVMLTGGLWKAGDGEATALPASNIYPTARATADSVNTPPATSVPKTTAAAATKTTEKENPRLSYTFPQKAVTIDAKIMAGAMTKT